MSIRYFATFNEDGTRKDIYIADNMPYSIADIYKLNPQVIEVSADNWQKLLNGYIRLSNGTYDLPKDEIVENKDLIDLCNLKIEQVNNMLLNELLKTDHKVLEYFEMNNTNNSDYITLKLQRQELRNKAQSLIDSLNLCTTIEELNNIIITF